MSQLDRWDIRHNQRTLVLEVTDDPKTPFRLTGRRGEIELTEHELNWLSTASAPAALVRLRRDRAANASERPAA